MLLRQLPFIDRGVRAGGWPKPPGRSLRGLTIGIIGLGGIGRAVVPRAAAAGLRVIGSDPSPSSRAAATAAGATVVELSALLSDCDVVCVNAPLNESTHHLLDDAAFASMRSGVYVVNTGRGPVIDNDALVRALQSGQVAGAALDVFEDEPLPADHPLTRHDQTILGSHNASNTLEASARVHDIAIANLIEELT
ncbi:MAG: NAD(P)-dependent oxidoreductase, partial [Actinomycetota bacterium]